MEEHLTEDETKTLEYYQKNAKKWLSDLKVGKDNLLFEKQLQKFYGYLPSGKVLEIGCGAGNDGNWFAKKGYDYVGTDISPEMVEISRKRYPDIDFRIMPVYNLKFDEELFDGFWSSLTFLHIPKNKLIRALKETRRVMKNGGIGFISMKEGEGERFEQKKERFYSYYSEDEFKYTLENAGFSVIESEKETLGNTTFLLFFVKKL